MMLVGERLLAAGLRVHPLGGDVQHEVAQARESLNEVVRDRGDEQQQSILGEAVVLDAPLADSDHHGADLHQRGVELVGILQQVHALRVVTTLMAVTCVLLAAAVVILAIEVAS